MAQLKHLHIYKESSTIAILFIVPNFITITEYILDILF